jgi:hypothetical protein
MLLFFEEFIVSQTRHYRVVADRSWVFVFIVGQNRERVRLMRLL